MNLDAVRAELPVLEHCAFLNAGTFGPLPRASVEAQLAQLGRERAEGRIGADYYAQMHELRASARAAIARLIGAETDEIALTRSTGEGCAIVVNGLGLSPGDAVVTTDVEHYGLLGPFAASGAELSLARIQDRPAAEAFDAISALVTPRTRLIAVSHVAWSTGHVLPLAELVATGVPVLVDGAQSAGAIPVDVAELGCDFYTVSGQKWLLGPDATGGLFVHPRQHDELALSVPSYFGRTDHDERGVPVHGPGATRLDSGSVPLPSLAALVESLAFHEYAGDARFGRARELANRCGELLSARAEVVTEADQATLVSFRTSEPGAAVVERLARASVHVREIPELGWVRASVGFWTSDDELERLVSAL